MAKFVFKGHVLHDGREFKKGHECPKDIQDEMMKKGLIEALPEPVKPAEPPKAQEPKAADKK